MDCYNCRLLAASIVVCLLSLVCSDPVSFLSKPSVLTVDTGGIAIFPCKAVNLGEYDRVAWFSIVTSRLLSIDGHTLSSDNHVFVNIDPIGGYELHINNVTSRDAGEYKCMVTTDPVVEQNSQLIVVEKYKDTKRRKVLKYPKGPPRAYPNVSGLSRRDHYQEPPNRPPHPPAVAGTYNDHV